jgi:hypothetical protein
MAEKDCVKDWFDAGDRRRSFDVHGEGNQP